MNVANTSETGLGSEQRLLGEALLRGLRLYLRVARALLTAVVFVVVFGLAWLWSRPAGAQTSAAVEGGPAQSPPQDDVVLIRNARVVDVMAGTVQPGMSVLIEGGRISRISPMGSPAAVDPEGSRVIDAKNAFLVPGFVDTHAHVAMGPVRLDRGESGPVLAMTPDPAVPAASLRSLLAYGVTTARDPGGPAEILVDVRDQIERGELAGPRLVVAGEVIDTTEFPGLVARVETAEDVRREVRRQAKVGVDMIKLYASLEPALIEAGIEEAHEHGLQAVAHLQTTTWTEAARLGLDSVLHVLPGSPQLLDAADADLLRREMKLGTQYFYRWFERVDFESPAIRELVETLVEHETFVDPTSVLYESVFLGGDRRREGIEALELAPASLLDNWRTLFHFNIGWTDQHFDEARAVWPKVLDWLRLLHEAGVRLTAGTDANNPWIVAGPSWHRELEIFVEAGIEPADVLRIATVNGAAALGLGREIGTVEVGKTADLVLLRDNPLEQISATRSIQWVMRSGRVHAPATLIAVAP